MKPFKYGCVVSGDNFCPRPQLEKQLREFAAAGQTHGAGEMDLVGACDFVIVGRAGRIGVEQHQRMAEFVCAGAFKIGRRLRISCNQRGTGL